jgi:hypothetical protein
VVGKVKKWLTIDARCGGQGQEMAHALRAAFGGVVGKVKKRLML